MEILVIGAGIVGLGCAHALAAEGHAVTILDREGAAAGASQGNAGWLAHADIAPIASPQVLRRVPAFLMDPLGPLAIRWPHAPALAPWLLRFLAASRPAAHRRSMEALIALQARAMPAWRTLAESLSLSRFVHEKGGLYVFDRADAFAGAQPIFARQRQAGIDLHLLGPEEVRRLEPALNARALAAVFHPGSAHVSDPRDFTMALFDAARARGVRFLRGEARAIAPGDGAAAVHLADGARIGAERVVLAAGVWSKPLARGLGDRIPLESEGGYNVSFPGCRGVISRPIAFEGHGFVATPLDSGLRIGGGVEFAGLGGAPNHARTRALHAKAMRFLSGAPPFESGRVWMGRRPSLPDSLPAIGASRTSAAVLYAFGHGHYGLTQAAATGELIADLVAARAPAIDLRPFSPQRF